VFAVGALRSIDIVSRHPRPHRLVEQLGSFGLMNLFLRDQVIRELASVIDMIKEQSAPLLPPDTIRGGSMSAAGLSQRALLGRPQQG
jgi:hypothetical protein